MAIISRLTTWAANQLLKAADLNNEFNNITNLFVNLDAGTTTWTNVKVTTLSPQANVAMSTFKLTGLGAGSAAGESVRYEQLANIQSVNTSTTTSTSTTGSSFVDVTSMTASITPSSASNKILIQVYGFVEFSATAAGQNASVTILRGASNLGDATSGVFTISSPAGNTLAYPFSWIYLDSPSTTSSTTYKVQIKSDGTRTFFWNRLALAGGGTIRVSEVTA